MFSVEQYEVFVEQAADTLRAAARNGANILVACREEEEGRLLNLPRCCKSQGIRRCSEARLM